MINLLDLGSAVGYLLLDTSGFSTGFGSALQAVKTMQSQSAKTSDKFAAMGSVMTSVGGTLTRNVTVPLLGLGATSVTAAAKFESSMSQVQATLGITSDAMSTLDGQSVNTMEALSSLALEMGATTKFSATEAAAAINNMAMAGYDVQEIYQSLPQVLNLASAGALDLDYATQLVANGLNVMGMETSDAQELTDKLAVTASNAYGSVSDFGEGLLVAGAQAKLANVSLTDTMTALGILGDNGISAGEGGTYLRNTLKNLYTPTEDAAKALTELGVETANSDGTLRDFQVVLQDLGGALDGLTEEQRITYMSRIFDTRTISAANALIENSGDRWDELSAAIDNAGGAAGRMADTQLNNLSGQLTILKSSLEGAAIAFGKILLPAIKNLIKTIQNVTDWVNNLNDSQKETLVKILEIVAAVGPLLIVFGKFSKSIGSIIKLVSGVGGLSPVLSALTGPIGIIIAAAGLLAAAWATNFGGIRDVTARIVGMIKNTVQAFLSSIKSIWENDLYGIRTTAEQIWASIESVFEAFLAVIESVFKVFTSALQGDWSAAWEGVKELGANIWNLIATAFSAFLDSVVGILSSIGSALYDAAVTVWGKISEGASAAWEAITTWFEGVKEDPIGTLKSTALSMLNAAKVVWGKIKTGASTAWNAVLDWFGIDKDKAVEKLKELKESMYSAAVTVWNRIKAGASAAWETVTTWFDEVKEDPVGTLKSTALSMYTAAISVWGKIQNGASVAWETVIAWFGIDKDKVVDKLKELKISMYNTAVTVWGKIKAGAKASWEVVTTWFEEVKQDPVTAINSIATALYDAGKDIINKLWEGLKASWESVASWVTEKANWIGSIFSIGGTGDTEGSHASGLDYVERDKIVKVHEGEGILTKEQNRDYRNGRNNSGGDTFNFYSPKALNPTSAAREMRKAKQQLASDLI